MRAERKNTKMGWEPKSFNGAELGWNFSEFREGMVGEGPPKGFEQFLNATG